MADNAFQGRGAGTPGGLLASAWIAQQMDEIGLSVLEGHDGRYQSVPMIRTDMNYDISWLEFRGNNDGNSFTSSDDIAFRSSAQTCGLRSVSADVVFVGYGIVAPEFGWNDYRNVDVKGKAVIVLINDPGSVKGDDSFFVGAAMTYYGRWTYKIEEASRHGALAVVIVHSDASAGYPFSLVQTTMTGPYTHLVSSHDRADVEAWCSASAAKSIFALCDLNFDILAASAASVGFKPINLPITLRAEIQGEGDHVVCRNVLGAISGCKQPEEYVFVLAHWDHLGIIRSPDGDVQIFPGAVDNATGVSALLAIAEYLLVTKTKLNRTIVFAAVTGEEGGLIGSQYLAENLPIPRECIVTAINLDGYLPIPPTRDILVFGHHLSTVANSFVEVAAARGRSIRADTNLSAGYFYRSDQINLAKIGIPAIHILPGLDLVDGGEIKGLELHKHYANSVYHTSSDGFNANWDFCGMAQDIELICSGITHLSNSGVWPIWLTEEFKR